MPQPNLPVPYLQEAMVNVQRAVEGMYPSSCFSSARHPPVPENRARGAADGLGGIGVALGIQALRLKGSIVKLFKVTDTLKSAAGPCAHFQLAFR